jgi:hypothetical protein
VRRSSLRATVWLFAAWVALGSPGLATSASRHSKSAAAEISRIEQATESIRLLVHKRPVRVVFERSPAFNASVQSSFRGSTPESEITLGQKELVLLGWIKRTQSYHKIVFQGLTNQVLGLYEPRQQALYVRSDDNEALGIRRDAIAHEYTHALQDQYFNLRKLLPDQGKLTYRNSDRIAAIHALTEGDAVTTQLLFISKHYSPGEYREWAKLQQAPVKGPSLPKAIYRDFYFPYDDGLNFTEKLYLNGGIRAINRAYRRLPQSTYEIMHPSAYLRGWKPAAVKLHHVRGFGHWKQLDDDVMGAFGYKLMIWEYLDKSLATKITDAYRGDRYVFLEKGGRDAALFRSQWTTAAAALNARNALALMLRRRYGGRVTVRGANPELMKTPDGAAYFRLSGKQLDLAIGPSSALAQQLGRPRTR